MIYIIGVLWLLYSGFWFYVLNDAIKNDLENVEKDYGEKLPESYLKNYLICNLITAIIAPVVHLLQVFFWCVSKCYLLLKKIVFGTIDLISNVVTDLKGKK